MASITNFIPSHSARWALGALLRRLQSAPRPVVVPIEVETAPTRDRRKKRYYAPQRDRFIEQSSMAREMYRL